MHEITLVTPFPAGEGGRGDRGQKESKWQGRQATRKASPPPGTAAARSAGNQPGKPPAGFMFEKVCKCRRRLNAGDARGGAPCMK